MNDLVIAVVSLILGVIGSVWVSAHYFRRSVRKSLTPYIQYSSSPFKGLDRAVRDALSIRYRGTEVADLFEIQFLIANTGDKAIRDVIEPLMLELPTESELLDATIIHRSPDELRVSAAISEDRRKITCEFPLLNSSDFFILKLLLNGAPEDRNFKFGIVVDELPPILPSQSLPYDAVGTPKKRKLEFPLLGVGLVFVILGLAQVRVLYDALPKLPSLDTGALAFLSGLANLSILAMFLSVAPAFFFLVIGTMMSIAAMADGSFPPKKKKFVIPEHVRGRSLRVTIQDD